MATGTIKSLVTERGFGFIEPDGGSVDVFFHSSSLPDGVYDSLSAGQKVEYEVQADPRNPSRSRAANVRVSA